MKLSQLIADCNVISIKGNENVEVMGITSDSRQVRQGSLLWLLRAFALMAIPI